MNEADLDKLFGGTSAATTEKKTDFERVAEGPYKTAITDATIKTDKNAVSIEYTITSGDFAKRKLWANYQLTETGIPWLKKDLKTLGINENTLTTFKGMADALESVVGFECSCTVKHNGKYDNVYLNKAIGVITDETPLLTTPGFDQSEEIPF